MSGRTRLQVDFGANGVRLMMICDCGHQSSVLMPPEDARIVAAALTESATGVETLAAARPELRKISGRARRRPLGG